MLIEPCEHASNLSAQKTQGDTQHEIAYALVSTWVRSRPFQKTEQKIVFFGRSPGVVQGRPWATQCIDLQPATEAST